MRKGLFSILFLSLSLVGLCVFVGCGSGGFKIASVQANSNCTQNNSCVAALSWSASTSAGVLGYKVYWGTTSGVYTQLMDVGNVTSAMVPGLGEGTYYFAVAAYASSNVTFAWTPVSGATGYTIYWGTTSGAYTHSLDVGNLTTTIPSGPCSTSQCNTETETLLPKVTGLSPNTTYYFNETPYTIVNGSEVQGSYMGEYSVTTSLIQSPFLSETVVEFTSAGIQTGAQK